LRKEIAGLGHSRDKGVERGKLLAIARFDLGQATVDHFRLLAQGLDRCAQALASGGNQTTGANQSIGGGLECATVGGDQLGDAIEIAR
jgi:hypothetical protein